MPEIQTTVQLLHVTEGALLLETGDYLLLETGDHLLMDDPRLWTECPDVLVDPGPEWEYGLPGNDPMDLVATTGILTFTLDNSEHNSASLAGYYSPGHANCPDWFTDDLPVRVIVERLDTHASSTRFVGECMGFRPTSGLYGEGITEVEAHDWMEHASVKKLGQLPITADATADDALTLALAQFEIQPEDTDFDVGDETWDYVFVTDDSTKMSMASLFQKLARNELGGHIFLEGDGTLRFDSRSYRWDITDADFALDAATDHPMSELDVAWLRRDIKNRIECKCFPSKTDAAATTLIWKLQQTFPLAKATSMTLVCPYRDPDTGARISAIDVVTPLVSGTHIKFGTVDDGSTNDLIGDLTFPMTVGANSAEIVLTNTGAVDGFVNFLELRGKGIYTYEPMVMSDEDVASIANIGVRPEAINLDLINDPNRAQAYATLLLSWLVSPHASVERVQFLANYNDDFATAAIELEPNSRFSIAEPQTGINDHFFACRISYEQRGPRLWVTIVPAVAPAPLNWFIWDVAGHGWDEGVWSF